jgi:molecular chaperone GrpE
LEAFKKHGIERFDPTGEPFDPNHHHAIYEQIHPTAREGTVLEVKQPGYRHHNRLLRPAAVIVARRRPPASDGLGIEDTS